MRRVDTPIKKPLRYANVSHTGSRNTHVLRSPSVRHSGNACLDLLSFAKSTFKINTSPHVQLLADRRGSEARKKKRSNSSRSLTSRSLRALRPPSLRAPVRDFGITRRQKPRSAKITKKVYTVINGRTGIHPQTDVEQTSLILNTQPPSSVAGDRAQRAAVVRAFLGYLFLRSPRRYVGVLSPPVD
jgi:hypothetical protein